MTPLEAQQLAQRLLSGELSAIEFAARLVNPLTADLGFAQVDLDRQRRCGFPEVVFAAGKSLDSLCAILDALVADGTDALATRVPAEYVAALLGHFPLAKSNAIARTFRIPAPAAEQPRVASPGRITIVTAGTSDLPVAEEARETALWMGVDVTMIHDVGVAGPHRLPRHLCQLREADAVVVVAGMEGALPSVVGGYVPCPVVGVPTSVGYGASFGGLAALLGMLNSCAANVTVVNIDAGFKGAYIASLIAQNVARARAQSSNPSQERLP
ncbi:MAG: nickel pincer cofactor biosynthesis protein LarB [Pirellulales bacterium]|nr:nickel pincer cofactor biosynthesis protein LarB [Pirellulales bacterium]